ncbi:MAG: FHA domain-containing protein, partial [Planctomycetota bacterium]
MPWLNVVDRDSGARRRVVVNKASFVIGKLPTNDLCLNKQNISRAHCQIVHVNGGYLVRDLGSRNGTYVEGKRIQSEVPLQEGSRMDLGAIHIVFHEAEPEEAQPKAPPDKSGQQAPSTQPAKAARSDRVPARSSGEGRRLVPSALKKKIHERLLVDLDLRHTDIMEQSEEELREKANQVVRNIVATLGDEIPRWLPQSQLIKEVVDEAVGLGPIEDLLRDGEIDEIMVNDWDRIYVERKGRIELTDKSFTDRAQVIHIIRRIIAPLGRRIDESS